MTRVDRPFAHRIAPAVILLVIAAVYARTAWNEFAYDDRVFVMAPTDAGVPNPMVAEWQGVTTYFTSFYGRGVLTAVRNLRPVTVMSYALVHKVFDGPNQPVRAGPQHVVNVVLHMLASLLFYLVVRRLFASPWPAVVGMAFFGLHALRSDPVISVVGRAELLSFCFAAFGMMLYLQAMDRRSWPRITRLVLAGLAFFLAFSSKENALTWVVFLPLCRLVQRGGSLRGELLPLLGVVCVPAAAFIVLLVPILFGSSFEVDGGFNPLLFASGSVRFFSAVMVLGHAALQMLLPLQLSIDYGFNTFELVEHWYDYRFLVPFMIFLAVLVAGFVFVRAHPLLFLSVAMFFGFTFATSNIPILVETTYGERLMYTPATAIALVVAWIADRLSRVESRLPARIALGIAAVWIVSSCFVIDGRCRTWRDNATLFVNDASAHPRSMRLQAFAASVYRSRGEAIGFQGAEGAALLEQWKRCLDRGLAVHENVRHPQAVNDLAHFHLVASRRHRAAGEAAAARRELDIADRLLSEALASPLLQNTTGRQIHLQLSLLYGMQSNRPKEREHLQRALDCDPLDAQGYVRLADWELQYGKAPRAVVIMTEGLRRLPDRIDLRSVALDIAWTASDGRAYRMFLVEGERVHGDSHPVLQTYKALVSVGEGRYAEAVVLFESSLHRLQRDPPLPVYRMFPQALEQIGRKADALEFLRRHIDRPGLPKHVREEMRTKAAELERERPR